MSELGGAISTRLSLCLHAAGTLSFCSPRVNSAHTRCNLFWMPREMTEVVCIKHSCSGELVVSGTCDRGIKTSASGDAFLRGTPAFISLLFFLFFARGVRTIVFTIATGSAEKNWSLL